MGYVSSRSHANICTIETVMTEMESPQSNPKGLQKVTDLFRYQNILCGKRLEQNCAAHTLLTML